MQREGGAQLPPTHPVSGNNRAYASAVSHSSKNRGFREISASNIYYFETGTYIEQIVKDYL